LEEEWARLVPLWGKEGENISGAKSCESEIQKLRLMQIQTLSLTQKLLSARTSFSLFTAGVPVGGSVTGVTVGGSVTGDRDGAVVTGGGVGAFVTGDEVGAFVFGAPVGDGVVGLAVGGFVTGDKVSTLVSVLIMLMLASKNITRASSMTDSFISSCRRK
jgi:hypothetical protein